MLFNSSSSNNCSDGNTSAKAEAPIEPIPLSQRSSFFKYFNETIAVHSFGALSSSRSMSFNTSSFNNCSDGNTSAKAEAPIEPISFELRSSFYKYFNETIAVHSFTLISICVLPNISSSNKRSVGKAKAKGSSPEEPTTVLLR